MCQLLQRRFLDQWKHPRLDRCQLWIHLENGSFYTLYLFFTIGITEYHHDGAVEAHRCFDHIRDVSLLVLLVIIFQFLTGKLLMLPQIKICAVMNTFHLLPADREFVLYVRSEEHTSELQSRGQ